VDGGEHGTTFRSYNKKQWEGNITTIRKFMYKQTYKFKREEAV